MFTLPLDYRRHLERKTPCAPILGLGDLQAVYGQDVFSDPELERRRCHFCGRVFARCNSMQRHVRTTCKIAPALPAPALPAPALPAPALPAPTAENRDAEMVALYEHTIRLQEARLASLERQNKELRELCEEARMWNAEVQVQNVVPIPQGAAPIPQGAVPIPQNDELMKMLWQLATGEATFQDDPA